MTWARAFETPLQVGQGLLTMTDATSTIFYNIFTINHMRLVVISSNLNLTLRLHFVGSQQ